MNIQDKINKVLWDRRIITIPDYIDRPPGLDYVVLRDLKIEDRNLYLFIKKIEEEKALRDGVPSEKELMANAREGGYWGQMEDDIEKKSDEHLAFLRAEFDAKQKFKSRQNIIQLQIDDVIAKKTYVANKRTEFRMNSAEYAAHEFAAFSILRRITLDIYGAEVFSDDHEFLAFKHSYLVFLYYLVQEMMGEGVMPTVDIREIARSPEWRLVWVLCRENLSAIFNRPIGDLTLNHKILIYWSRVYDSALETTEPPSMEVINDNDRFDDWLANRDIGAKKKELDEGTGHQEEGRTLEGYYVEDCSCGIKAKNKGRGLGERLQHNPTCLFGTWHENSPEEKAKVAQRIYGRNSNAMRKFISSEQEHISRKGLIEEQHLRGKKSREILGLESKVTKRNSK